MTATGPGQPGAAALDPAAERISAAYTELFGSVPASIETSRVRFCRDECGAPWPADCPYGRCCAPA